MCVQRFTIDTMPELKRNVLNFGYGVNFKYEGMLSHSFDRFYVVTKFELPKIKDLRLTMYSFNPYMQAFKYFQPLYAMVHKVL